MVETMNDAQARVTAMAWHSGQWSALYSFGSTGAIPADEDQLYDLLREIDRASGEADSNASAHALDDLQRYVRVAGPRGPQPGWAGLWDDALERIL